MDMEARARDASDAPSWDKVWAVFLADMSDPNGIFLRMTGSAFAGWTRESDVIAYLTDVVRHFGGMLSKDGAFADAVSHYKRPHEVEAERAEEARDKDVKEKRGKDSVYGSGHNNSMTRDEIDELFGITDEVRNPDMGKFKRMLSGG